MLRLALIALWFMCSSAFAAQKDELEDSISIRWGVACYKAADMQEIVSLAAKGDDSQKKRYDELEKQGACVGVLHYDKDFLDATPSQGLRYVPVFAFPGKKPEEVVELFATGKLPPKQNLYMWDRPLSPVRR